jgi:hypothetical protein
VPLWPGLRRLHGCVYGLGHWIEIDLSPKGCKGYLEEGESQSRVGDICEFDLATLKINKKLNILFQILPSAIIIQVFTIHILLNCYFYCIPLYVKSALCARALRNWTIGQSLLSSQLFNSPVPAQAPPPVPPVPPGSSLPPFLLWKETLAFFLQSCVLLSQWMVSEDPDREDLRSFYFSNKELETQIEK